MMARRLWRAPDGRIMAAGCRPYGYEWDLPGGDAGRTGDRELDKPERPCARCGKRFAPTIRRRLLCYGCFSGADESAFAP